MISIYSCNHKITSLVIAFHCEFIWLNALTSTAFVFWGRSVFSAVKFRSLQVTSGFHLNAKLLNRVL